jgi:putative membrane protein
MASPVPRICLILYGMVWLALAVAPRYPADWVLENIPTLAVVPGAIALHRRIGFSDRACVQALVFGILHAVGSHYTYSEVPLGEWLREGFGLARNHYDRIVHFAFGLLGVRPARELAFPPGTQIGRGRQLVLSVTAVTSMSVAYEILEWLVASVADPAAGTAFLGTQGDQWDAQKDMALAALGAALALAAELPARRNAARP